MGARFATVVAMVSSGCSLFLGEGGPDEQAGRDGGGETDAASDAAGAYEAWGRTVDAGELDGALSWTAACEINTTTLSSTCVGVATPLNDDGVIVVGAESVIIDAAVTVTGDRPLVIESRTLEISIDGAINAIGQRSSSQGGASYCTTGLDANVTKGAGGGGLGASGGNGGSGSESGESVPLEVLDVVSVGCPGGEGGAAEIAAGGGGVHLIATDSLIIDGEILAHGASGAGGLTSAGGGGGGSGGMIVLDSRSIEVNAGAALAANGGSGGAGGSSTSEGNPGVTSRSSSCTAPGTSGVGGNGGAGGCVSRTPEGSPGQSGSPGGGGGGGGVGYILVHGDPEPMIVPATPISPPVIALE